MIDPPLEVICEICRGPIAEPVDLADFSTNDAVTMERTVHLAHAECAHRVDPEKERWSYAD